MSSNTVGSSEAPRSAEGGFGYSGHSLEKLRLLASSIDTGRIVQMQLEFSHVSQHLNDVAAQLAAIRNELPNWWQGPAADSITAHFAPVIQRARDTESMASGAALALQHCAQVAGEQQEAMKRVPEVPDPNTAAPTVITPPGIPPGAELAAVAAQERAYSAARAEAAGHVNGIAAQYVETTAQLQGLSDQFVGEGFQPISANSSSSIPHSSGTSVMAHAVPQFSAIESVKLATSRENGFQTSTGIGSPASWSPTVGQPAAESWIPPTASVAFGTSPQRAAEAVTAGAASTESVVVPSFGAGTVVADGIGSRSSAKRKPPSRLESPLVDAGPQAHALEAEPYLHYGKDGRARFGSPSRGVEPVATERIATDRVAAERQMYGAPGTVGIHAGSEKDKRGQRPNYLKESRSVWLPDNSAAPHDGLLTPDWADKK